MVIHRRHVQRHGERPVLYGRDRERAHLQERFAEAISGAGSLVLISGEAGIGKTTLIEALASEAGRLNMLVLSGGCYDLTTTPPYGPWVEMLRGYPASPGLPPVPLQLRERADLEQAGSQEQLFRIIAGFLAEIAAARPLLLVLEDLHWSDLASIELLRYLARQLAGQRMLIIASYRDDELTRSHPLFASLPLLVREARAERLELQPFDGETLSTFIESQYPLSENDRQALGDYLLQHTEGNPLFAAELLRALELERVLSEDEQGWRLGELDEVVPPPLIVQMIERHLTNINSATREALEIAAVLGQEIPIELWQRLARLGDEASAMVIEQALVARLIESHGGSRLRFRHALIREVLYQGMLFPRRRQVHRRAAELLVEYSSPDSDLVASHFQHAGDERAVDWLIEAGHQAAQAYAAFSAADRFAAALRMLEQDGTRLNEQGWLHLRIAILDRGRAPDRSVAAAEAALHIGKESGDVVLTAWALWQIGIARVFIGENGLPEMQQGLAAFQRLPKTAFERIPERFQQIAQRWRIGIPYYAGSIAIIQSIFGRYLEGLATAERVLATVAPPDDDHLIDAWNERAHGLAARAVALAALGNPEEAKLAYRETKEGYRKAENIGYAALHATGELQYVALAYEADQLTRRQQLAAEAVALWTRVSGMTTRLPPRYGLLPLLVVEGAWVEARQIAAPFANRYLVFPDYASLALGVIARAQGEPDAAWNQVKMAIPEGPDTEPGTHPLGPFLDMYRLAADLALDEGDLVLARRWIEAHDRWLEWSGRVQGRAEAQLLWARYHWIVGDGRQARHHAGQALEHASDPRQPLALVAALRMLGELDLLDEHLDKAGERLRQSLELAESCAAPYEQALTLLALAELSAATSEPDAAWTQLDQARAVSSGLEATPALQRATAIAARLAVRRGKPVYPAGLTPREVDVLRLVANGLTDVEAAKRLFVSPRTVNSHLTSVYNKLGVNSRVEAVRFAVEHGLTDSSSR